MSISVVSRSLDKLGRLVIPSEIRKSHGLNPGDTLDVYVHGSNLLLRSHKVQTEPITIPPPLIEELIQAVNNLSENNLFMFIDLINRTAKH